MSRGKLIIFEQIRDLEAERVESICPAAAAGIASELRDLLNDSGRVNQRKGGCGAVPCILSVPAVSVLYCH